MNEPLFDTAPIFANCRHGIPMFLPCFLCANPSPPFVHHSQESFDAATSIHAKAPSLRDKVLELLKTGEFTDEMIARELGLNPSTARPRRIELTNMGLIESCGTALTAAKRSAVLWRAVPMNPRA